MKLVRFATLYFEPTVEKWNSWKLDLDGVIVKTEGYWVIEKERKSRLLVSAEVSLDARPSITSDGDIEIPIEARKRAEKAIETAANIISVSEMSKRSISSPNPSTAFLPEDSETLEWLDKTKGIEVLLKQVFGARLSFQDAILKNDLEDRFDGISLMAEALANEHPTGKFHELLRLFERAFGLSSNALVGPLSEFLAQKGYTKTEVENWVVKLRHPATHADNRKSFVLESDIRPVINRMEQAAYDVLFNKLRWHGNSIERRNFALFDVHLEERGLRLIKGSTPILKFQLLDEFGAYPVDLSMDPIQLPTPYWSKRFSPAGE